MNLKHLLLFVLGGFVIGLLFGLALHGSVGYLGGTTTNYQSALSQAALYNWEKDAATDLSNIRSPLSGLGASTTAIIDFPAFNASSTPQSTTTQVTGLAGSLGDLVLVENASTTVDRGYAVVGSVSIASTTSATFEIDAVSATTTAAFNPGPTTYNLWVLPAGTFKAPAALNISTTTTP